jgi:simple sugar transport system ATP-binding protein
LDDKAITIHSPKDSIKAGIGMVHQHFMLIPVFTVAENIMLGDETTRFGVLDEKAVETRVRELSKENGLDVDPGALVGELPVGVQQRVEIVKALYRNAHILILDEPTAVLTPQEADELFVIMRKLTKRGVSIIFITHKQSAGHCAGSRSCKAARWLHGQTEETNEAKLASMMVGR